MNTIKVKGVYGKDWAVFLSFNLSFLDLQMFLIVGDKWAAWDEHGNGTRGWGELSCGYESIAHFREGHKDCLLPESEALKLPGIEVEKEVDAKDACIAGLKGQNEGLRVALKNQGESLQKRIAELEKQLADAKPKGELHIAHFWSRSLTEDELNELVRIHNSGGDLRAAIARIDLLTAEERAIHTRINNNPYFSCNLAEVKAMLNAIDRLAPKPAGMPAR